MLSLESVALFYGLVLVSGPKPNKSFRKLAIEDGLRTPYMFGDPLLSSGSGCSAGLGKLAKISGRR
jgi:hypothetical protein